MATKAYRNILKSAETAIFKSMSDEELESLCAGLPEVDLSRFSNQELESLTDGSASPLLVRRLHELFDNSGE
jgi:hypothetical protein